MNHSTSSNILLKCLCIVYSMLLFLVHVGFSFAGKVSQKQSAEFYVGSDELQISHYFLFDRMTEQSPKENFDTMEDQSNKAADDGASCTTPAIKISSFDCISIEGDLWDKKLEAFDSIAKSLPCNHLGMSESTSDIPIALQPLHPSPPTNHRTLNKRHEFGVSQCH